MQSERIGMCCPGYMGPPMPGAPGQMMPGMAPIPEMPGFTPTPGAPSTPGAHVNNALENRLSTLERQLRRLESKVSRIETQLQGTTPLPSQPFQQPQEDQWGYPYQASMQMM